MKSGTDSLKVTAEWVLKQQVTAIMIIFLYGHPAISISTEHVHGKKKQMQSQMQNTVDISVEKKEDGWYLKTNLYDIIKEETNGIISTETLGMAFEPEQKYENPDGSPIIFNQDFFGNHRDVKTVAGPFTDKKASEQKLF